MEVWLMVSIDFSNIMRHKTDYLDLDEIDKMLQYCYDEGNIRNYMLVLTLSRTGRRISEIVGARPFTANVGLRPVDIKYSDKLIEWDILKKNPIKSYTKRGIKVSEEKLKKLKLEKKPKRMLKPVDDEYMDYLTEYIASLNINPYERIFSISRQRADQIIKEIAKECKIVRPNKKIHVHQFRHGFAINFLKSHPSDPSAPIKLQMILDHSSFNVTQHYLQFTQEDIKKSLNKTFGVEQ